MATGQDVTWQDNSLVQGEPPRVNDNEAQFAKIALGEGLELRSIRPTWYTEDWITLDFGQSDEAVIRADRNSIRGAIMLTPDGVSVMNIGDNNLQDVLDVNNTSPLPSRPKA